MQIPGHMLTNCSSYRPGRAERIRENSCIYKLSKEKNAAINRRGSDNIIKQYKVSYKHRNNNNTKAEIAY